MRWLALLRPAGADGRPAPPWPEALVWWALQFTPRVARLEDALLLELAASLRLFKGRAALQQRLLTDLSELLGPGQAVLAWAPNSQAALALARAGAPGEVVDGCLPEVPLPAVLDRLPFPVLSQADAHAPLLARLGCRVLADLRQLPRAQLARRTSTQLLRQLDHAYGQLGNGAEAHDWCRAPEQFEAKRELPQRSDDAALLLHHAEPLLRAACLWLAARHAGSRALQFGWQYDSLRARSLGPGGEFQLSSAEPHRQMRVWQRLLAEHLNRLPLQAPVSDLWLRIAHAEPLQEDSASLLAAGPDAQAPDGETLPQLLQRLAVRLGPEQVRQAQARADHRPEHQQRWQAWGAGGASAPAPAPMPLPGPPSQWPQPSWLLNPPLPLACLREQPLYQGPLTLLAGPQRVESGWWEEHPGSAARRDYYLAHGRGVGLVWLYRERQRSARMPPPSAAGGWFLHGLFA